MQICNAYILEVNRFECYSDVLKGIHDNDGYVPNTGYTILDQDCLDYPIENEWEICLYDSFILAAHTQITPDTPSAVGYNNRNTIQEKTRQKILDAAMNDSNLKSKICKSIQWQTWGNNAMGEGPMKNFAITECGLKDYLDKKDFFN